MTLFPEQASSCAARVIRRARIYSPTVIAQSRAVGDKAENIGFGNFTALPESGQQYHKPMLP